MKNFKKLSKMEEPMTYHKISHSLIQSKLKTKNSISSKKMWRMSLKPDSVISKSSMRESRIITNKPRKLSTFWRKRSNQDLRSSLKEIDSRRSSASWLSRTLRLKLPTIILLTKRNSWSKNLKSTHRKSLLFNKSFNLLLIILTNKLEIKLTEQMKLIEKTKSLKVSLSTLNKKLCRRDLKSRNLRTQMMLSRPKTTTEKSKNSKESSRNNKERERTSWLKSNTLTPHGHLSLACSLLIWPIKAKRLRMISNKSMTC